jgi:Uma2 family endonuclease
VARDADRRNDDVTVAPERPVRVATEGPVRLIDVAEMVHQLLPGHRSEILGGQLIVNPPADFPHSKALTKLTLALAILRQGKVEVVQGVGLWLPTGEEDHLVPDLAVVDDDAEDHVVAYRCLEPSVFRMVVEITSTNWRDDLERKPGAYAAAGVPVYVIGDRKHGEVVVLTEPKEGEYRSRTVYRPGESCTLPESIGDKVEVEADIFLGS